MPVPSRRSLVFCLLLLAFSMNFAVSVIAQPPASRSGDRQPFVKPGAPKQAERVRTFDVRHIKGELTLDIKKSEIRGTVTHSIAPLHPGLDSITLDCGDDLKVSRVAIGPDSCKFEQKAGELVVKLGRPYGVDDLVQLAVTYAGSPKKGVHFIKPGTEHPKRLVSVWTVGEPEDARHWIPCYDYPNERSTSEMIVTVDQPLTVVSNGVLASKRDNTDGTSTFHWKMEGQLTTYLLSIVAADFAVYHDKLDALPVDYYVLKDVDEATARRTFGKTPRMIEFFNKAIGTPYAYAKYAQACLPDFNGGMEHTSATTMTDSILLDPIASLESNADSIVGHELAHQWFGDLLTCRDWSNLWLNEGFASYFDPLFTEHDLGDDAFRIAMAADLSSYLGSDRQYRRPIVEARFDDPWRMFDGVTYAKGAYVLHALRGLVGDDAWWRGIRVYVAKNKDRNVVTDDFRKAMEEASGRDLVWFFDQWVFHGGHPELAAKWRYEDEDKTIRLKVDQTQATDEMTPLFRLPTTVEISDETGVREVPVVIDGKSQEFVIPASRRPKMVRIDPKGWIPKVLSFDKPADEWVYQLEHAGNFPGRVEAAQALVSTHKGDRSVVEALAKAWPREKYPLARAKLVELIATLGEPARVTLEAAAKDSEARVRVAALGGLASVKLDPPLEAVYRATFANKSEANGARSAAFRALTQGKVKDSDDLVKSALKETSNNYRLAWSALQTVLNRGGQEAREAAVIYSRSGQPTPLRREAIRALSRQAKDDPQAEKLLVGLLDDPAEEVQYLAANSLVSGGFTAALPRLEQLLARTPGPSRPALEARVNELKSKGKVSPFEPDVSTKEASDLERQAASLELQARDLRNKAEAIKIKAEKAKQATSKSPA